VSPSISLLNADITLTTLFSGQSDPVLIMLASKANEGNLIGGDRTMSMSRSWIHFVQMVLIDDRSSLSTTASLC
jgi:hypothetical protein